MSEGKLVSQAEDLAFRQLSLEDQQEVLLAKYREYNHSCETGGTVLVGDSLTEFLPDGKLSLSGSVYNRGIRGIGVAFLQEHVVDLALALQPRQLVLLIGTNDLMFGMAPQDLVAAIEALVESIQAALPACHLFVQSLYPRRESKQWGPALLDEIDLVNLYLRHLPGVTYVDMHGALADDEGFLSKDYTKDGVHLTLAGYRVVLEVLVAVLD